MRRAEGVRRRLQLGGPQGVITTEHACSSEGGSSGQSEPMKTSLVRVRIRVRLRLRLRLRVGLGLGLGLGLRLGLRLGLGLGLASR